MWTLSDLLVITNEQCHKFGAIIRANKRRRALRCRQGFERIQDLVTGDRTCRMNDQTLTSIFIHHRQHLHGPTIRGPIHNEIPRPDVPCIGRLHRIAHRRPSTPFLLAHRSHPQTFLPTHPLDPFAIDRPAGPAQQLMNKPIAPTRMFFRQRDNLPLQSLPPISGALGRIIITRGRQIDQRTRPPRRAQSFLGDMLDYSFFVRRAYHFFELTS